MKNIDRPRVRVAARREADLVVRPKPTHPQRERRFKVQQYVAVSARDSTNKQFLLGDYWRTVIQADRQSTAERLLSQQRAEHPHRAWRVAEEWPLGSNLRPVTPEPRRIATRILHGGSQASERNHDQ